MRRGLSARNSSTPMPRRSIAPTRILLWMTSALRTRSWTIARPFADLRSTAILLLAALDAEQQPQLRSAHRVATIFLDLDHARAEIREEAIGERSRHIGAKVENQDTVERANSHRRRHCTAVPM